jgi:hypothetical protein
MPTMALFEDARGLEARLSHFYRRVGRKPRSFDFLPALQGSPKFWIDVERTSLESWISPDGDGMLFGAASVEMLRQASRASLKRRCAWPPAIPYQMSL